MNNSTIYSNEIVFLVGNQRSGTTWLANILNRSRRLSLYYEPFEKGLGFFGDFPEEPIYLEQFSESLAERFRNDLERLIQKKERLWHINKVYGQIINCFAVDLLWHLSRHGFCYKTQSIRQMRVVNQWHGNKKFSNLLEKEDKTVPFIKETRLHLKIDAILKALQLSKVILISRHPYPVIKSTVGWFKKDSLIELRKKIDFFLDIYKTQSALRNYYGIVMDNINGDIESKLLTHWIICNDNLIRVAKEYPQRVLLITYESLCRKPLSIVRQIAGFLHINFSELEKYTYNTSTTIGKYGIVDTKRISSVHYKQWTDKIEYNLYRKIVKYDKVSSAIKRLQTEYEEVI